MLDRSDCIGPRDSDLIPRRDMSRYLKGREETVSLRETNLFRMEDGIGKQIDHHADLVPHLVKGIQDES